MGHCAFTILAMNTPSSFPHVHYMPVGGWSSDGQLVDR